MPKTEVEAIAASKLGRSRPCGVRVAGLRPASWGTIYMANNILDDILANPLPYDTADWWHKQSPQNEAAPLDDEEMGYMEVYTSDAVPEMLRIGRGIANVGNLTPEEVERASKYFGAGPLAKQQFCNYENRRRIVAHYVLTHPATVAYEKQLYRLTRDVIPILFLGERVYELITGKEAFTGDEASRVWALVELGLAIIGARVLRAIKPAAKMRPPARPLTDPIYDLPPEGGGMDINGHWYTEHALERMAPDTPQVRAELRLRAVNRLERLGIKQGSRGFDKCLERAMSKIDPRGVPPSVVEAEIANPGSTNVKVIYIKRLQRVVTVIPKGPAPAKY